MEVFALIALCFVVWLAFALTGSGDTPPPPARRDSPVRDEAPPPKPKRAPQHEVGDTIIGPAYVVDGDTIVVNKTNIRLFGIDAPELEHPYGKNAKWALVNLCKGQQITVNISEADHFGRTVASCYLPDGRDLSAEMVRSGNAVDWPKFSGGIYKHLEVEGIRKKLWRCDARQKGRMPPA